MRGQPDADGGLCSATIQGGCRENAGDTVAMACTLVKRVSGADPVRLSNDGIQSYIRKVGSDLEVGLSQQTLLDLLLSPWCERSLMIRYHCAAEVVVLWLRIPTSITLLLMHLCLASSGIH